MWTGRMSLSRWKRPPIIFYVTIRSEKKTWERQQQALSGTYKIEFKGEITRYGRSHARDLLRKLVSVWIQFYMV